MDIQIEICDSLQALIMRREVLKAYPFHSVVLYQTADANGETGQVVLQSKSSNLDKEPEPIGNPTIYAGKFILVVRN